jgi:hypothetical protein
MSIAGWSSRKAADLCQVVVEELQEVDLIWLERRVLLAYCVWAVEGRHALDQLGRHAQFAELRLNGMRRYTVFGELDGASGDGDGLWGGVARPEEVWGRVGSKPVDDNGGFGVGEEETDVAV